MSYILILTIILSGGYGPQVSTSTAEFATAEACDAAGRMVGKDVDQYRFFARPPSVFFQCAPKGVRQ